MPSKPRLTNVQSVRLAPDLVERIDAFAESARQRDPGPRWSRGDALRFLLERGLAATGTNP